VDLILPRLAVRVAVIAERGTAALDGVAQYRADRVRQERQLF
jgi:hypothetical protein